MHCAITHLYVEDNEVFWKNLTTQLYYDTVLQHINKVQFVTFNKVGLRSFHSRTILSVGHRPSQTVHQFLLI